MDPVQLKHSENMNQVAEALNFLFAGYGFCLFVFDWGESTEEGRRMNYISNAKRGEMIAAIKEWIAEKEKE